MHMTLKKRYHFIAIGGAVMHQLALHLHNMGHKVSGSDDAIYDPAKSNLEKHGILPSAFGWFPDIISPDMDAVILGMHAKADNPELLRAQELGINIYSFPEFVYESSKDKKRIVVAGSHGKTTTTSMIMHVLRTRGIDFDYLVGAQIEGFDYVVRISESAKVIILEGDEYLTSPLDLTSKFLHYHPALAIITGVAWDHINVFPSFEGYVDTFRQFMKSVTEKIFFYEPDAVLQELAQETMNAGCIAYDSLPSVVVEEEVMVLHEVKQYPLQIFGAHNMANLSAALNICLELGISREDFFESMSSFSGAAKRMEQIAEDKQRKLTVFKDFAHAPSKVTATVKAIRERYPDRKFIAALELHTFSSLQPEFIIQYKGSLLPSDAAAVYVDAEALRQKDRAPIDPGWLKEQFGSPYPATPANSAELRQWILDQSGNNSVVLMMSSGHWGGMKPEEVATQICGS
jgi:UDP-N-acetylmuramate: L-alanyl-gamma-D-glutamyl-meso-diaminopimelate ligase